MHANVLVFNAGSPSLKFALFRSGSELERIAAGAVERIGRPDTELKMKQPARRDAPPQPFSSPDHASHLGLVLEKA